MEGVSRWRGWRGGVSNAGGGRRGVLLQGKSEVAEMDGIAQQNAAMVGELAATAQSLTGQVVGVRDALGLFRLRASDRSVAETSAVELRGQSKGL